MSTTTHMSGITAYVSSKDAARSVGYTSDYIARLAREGKILSHREGIQWFVEMSSLEMFLKAVERSREDRKAQLREERRKERENHRANVQSAPLSAHVVPREHTAHDIADLRLAREDDPSVHHIGRAVHAHTVAASSLVLGVAVAVLIVFSGPIVPVAERSTASLMDSFLTVTRFAWSFAFPWDSELARAPEPVVDLELDAKGIVALPPGSEDAKTIERVRESFSDDVVVRLDEDRTTGTIVPVFSDGPGDEYGFVIVPVQGSQ